MIAIFFSHYNVSQVYVQSGSTVTTQRKKTNIPTASCNLNSFQYMSQLNFNRLSIGEFLCPTNKDVTVAANFYAPQFDYVEIKVFRCNSSTSTVTCKTNISDIMKQTQLAFMVSNNYLDFNNYNDPVQSYLDDRFFWDLAPGFRKKADIYVKNNQANLIDDFVQLGQSNNFTFYQVSSMRESVVVEDTDLQIASAYIRFDSNYDAYSRRIYSIGDLLGQTGGMYSSVLLMGGLLVGIFSERLFVSSILRKIYQIDEVKDEDIKTVYENSKQNVSIKAANPKNIQYSTLSSPS